MAPELTLLRQLTDGLTSAPTSKSPPPMSVSLLRGSNLTAMEIHQFAGSETSKHIHTGRHEWIGVIYGCIKVVFDDDGAEVTLKDYDTCHVSPDRPHYVVAIEDSLAWTVTVPPDEHIPTEKSQETKDVA